MKNLSNFSLKIIALVTMTIDHIGLFFAFPYSSLFRIIGRISFPIFVFLLVEGFYHTKDRRKYFFRLFLFALLSEPIYDYALSNTFYDPLKQNIFFTLSFGLLMLIAINKINIVIHKNFNKIEDKIFCFLGDFLIVLFFSLLASIFFFDYGMLGILLIFFCYLFHQNLLLMYLFYFLSVLFTVGPTTQLYCLFSIVPLFFYSSKKGKNIKYFFYVYYPLHFFLLSLLSKM